MTDPLGLSHGMCSLTNPVCLQRCASNFQDLLNAALQSEKEQMYILGLCNLSPIFNQIWQTCRRHRQSGLQGRDTYCPTTSGAPVVDLSYWTVPFRAGEGCPALLKQKNMRWI